MRRIGLMSACIAGTLAAAGPVGAVDYSISLGVGVAPDYEGSDDYRAIPLWNLRAQNLYHPATYVAVEGLTIKSNLIAHPNWRLGPALQYVPGRSDVDNNRVDQMQNIGSAGMVGAVGGYDFNLNPDSTVFLEAFGRQAVTDDNGFLGTLAGGWRGKLLPQLRLRAQLSSTWASEDYMSEYFGVTSTNATRSGLDQYNADAGFKDITFGAALTYDFTANWNATVLGSYGRLLGDAKDSPITDDAGNANQLFGGVTVGYRF